MSLLVIAMGTLLATESCAATGASARGARLDMMQRSPNYSGDAFVNSVPSRSPAFLPTIWDWMKGGTNTTPATQPPIVLRSGDEFREAPLSGLRVTWLGHSTTLLELDGHRVLFDPIWSERASPSSFAGPTRFFPPPLPIDALPELSAVVISHDHYDHLDYPTVLALAERAPLFVVPLGVGAHLEHWGIPAVRIVELDWWGRHVVGGLELIATPARHFSGRSLIMRDRNAKLWCGWIALGTQHRVYYSGDTAMFPGFEEIGRRYGPFDLTMIEIGAYNAHWADFHLGPEQAVEAHRLVRGGLLLPVHWGTFDLALHSWTEPIERVLAAAAKDRLAVATPRPGESVEPRTHSEFARWWPSLPWQQATEAPIVSSGL